MSLLRLSLQAGELQILGGERRLPANAKAVEPAMMFGFLWVEDF
jgi:hypothetical protein